MNEFFMWVFAVLGYLFCGLLYVLCYLIAYKPAKGSTALGLMLLGWPVYVVIEIILQLASGVGSVAKNVNNRLKGLTSGAEEA